MNRKGFIGITLTVGVLLVIALILVIVFGGFSLFAWMLGITVWRLAGVAILVIVALTFLKGGMPFKAALLLVIVGFVLVLLPAIFSFMEAHTIGAILSIT